MNRMRLLRLLMLSPVMLLGGCGFESGRWRVGVLVLIPFLLIIGVLWLLHRRPSPEEDDWQEGRLPDADEDDDKDDHFLM